MLEIGTGSGYQGAVLATLGLEVYTVERIEELLRIARRRFRNLGLNLRTKHDDGRLGWPEHGPFDAIIVTAAGAHLDRSLLEQLADGGTLIAPVGGSASQKLLRTRKTTDGLVEKTSATWCSCPWYRESSEHADAMKVFQPLYDRAITWARHRHAPWLLYGLSFIEAIFFPVMPELMLAPMCLAQPKRGWWFATISLAVR